MRTVRFAPWLPPLAGLALLIFFRDITTQAVKDGIDQCLYCVIPSLLPFFILSNLLVGSNFPDLLAEKCGKLIRRLFQLPPEGAAPLVIGLLGGYPIGAKTAAQLCHSGRISQKDGATLLAVCNNTGPAIFFGLAGGLLFHRFAEPMLLYLIHIISMILTGWLMRPKQAAGSSSSPRSSTPATSFTDAVWQGAVSCGKISALVISFCVMLQILFTLLPDLPPMVKIVITGFLDLPNGLNALQNIPNEGLRFILCSMFINWGGLCVHLQTKSVTQEVGIPLQRHCQAKGIMAGISGLLSFSIVSLGQGAVFVALGLPIVLVLLIFMKTRVEIHRKSSYNRHKVG